MSFLTLYCVFFTFKFTLYLENYDHWFDFKFSFGLHSPTFLAVQELLMWLVMSIIFTFWFADAFSLKLLLAIPVQKPLLTFRTCCNVGKAIMIDIRQPFCCSYQNYLTKETSDLLLSLLKPVSFFCCLKRFILSCPYPLIWLIPL